MRFFLFAILVSFGLFQSASIAKPRVDSIDGNLISDPALRDYVRAERTPGFSEVYDIVDQNAAPL